MYKLCKFFYKVDIHPKLCYNIYIKKNKGRIVLNTKKSNRLFKFFDFNRDNRPDAIEEDTTPTLKRYFKLLGRRFWKLVALNVMMLPMLIPVIVGVYLYLAMDKTPTANTFYSSNFTVRI